MKDTEVIDWRSFYNSEPGTPEGAKIANYTGLKKEDKRYLSLDKLTTFMIPALREEETIQRVFFDAGCSDLFEITQDLVADPGNIRSQISTKVLFDYLMFQPAIEGDKESCSLLVTYRTEYLPCVALQGIFGRKYVHRYPQTATPDRFIAVLKRKRRKSYKEAIRLLTAVSTIQLLEYAN